jgi:hypothetical protein
MNPLVQPDPGLYIWTILTFLLLLVAFNKLAWKPLKAMLQAREDTIRKSLEDAKHAREELERLQAESQRILAQARTKRKRSSRERETMQTGCAKSCGRRHSRSRRHHSQRRAADPARDRARVPADSRRSGRICRWLSRRDSCSATCRRKDNERLIEETFRQLEADAPELIPCPTMSTRSSAS